jgi:structural maintenance of chromosome 4
MNKMNATVSVPEGTRRLFDLIRPTDPIYRTAFYHGVRDTLVTEDWELANRVAYQGERVLWRIVTTTGNLIDTSGAMTGGGKPPSSGGMKAKCASKSDSIITAEQIAVLDAEVSRLQTELSQCRTNITSTEKELKDLEQQLKKIQIELEKSDLQVSRIESERQDINSRLTVLRSSCSLTREEAKEKTLLEKKLSDVGRRMDAIIPNRDLLQAKVKQIQQKILDAGGPGLKRAQSKVDSAISEFQACQGSLSAKEVSLASAVKQHTKAATSKTKAEDELEKVSRVILISLILPLVG